MDIVNMNGRKIWIILLINCLIQNNLKFSVLEEMQSKNHILELCTRNPIENLKSNATLNT